MIMMNEFTSQQIVNNKIATLKSYLSSTDYVVIKIAEGEATKEEYADVLAKRKEARAEINTLSEELK